MQIQHSVLAQIKNPKIRIKLAIALDVTDQSICIYIRNNSDELTKAAALKVIREELNLNDSEILEESEVRA